MKFFENFDLRQLNNLDLLAKQVVEGFIIGLHKSPFHGFSVEFAEHRIYNPGQSTKNVDWRVYGRTDKMYVKRYEEETNLRCQIVIDTSSSMYFPKGGDGLNKLQFSAVAGASLMNLLRKQRDAFSLSLFEDNVHTHTRAKSSTKHYNTMLTHLDKLINDTTTEKTTSTASAFHEIADSIHKRSMVIIFSDMFGNGENEEDLFSALQHLKSAKHEVILFHVVDKKHEIDFEYENRPYLFVDMESSEEIRLQSNQVKELYQEKVKAFATDLKMKCLQFNIDFVEADINEGFHPVLQSYLVKRSKMK
ncbi:DUF58 domain-containing protein [bacterium]|nr:DUF58 domain-containing protein [bacterium]